jgi:HD-like signal output (HDOD) protein
MIAGLLHDVGKFYILSRVHSFKGVIVDQDALWDIVDRWHLNIGEAILENWDAPEDVRVAVLNHRDLGWTHAGPPDLTDIVQAANILDAHRDLEHGVQIDWDSPSPGFVLLNLNQRTSQELMDAGKDEVELILQAIS